MGSIWAHSSNMLSWSQTFSTNERVTLARNLSEASQMESHRIDHQCMVRQRSHKKRSSMSAELRQCTEVKECHQSQ